MSRELVFVELGIDVEISQFVYLEYPSWMRRLRVDLSQTCSNTRLQHRIVKSSSCTVLLVLLHAIPSSRNSEIC